jgi:hypothetical protein
VLWIVPVMFSAAQKALSCGDQVFVSAGASLPGVFYHSSTLYFPPANVK